MPELAYVNGAFGPMADAKVSIEDRGFQFADGVYEVIVAFNGTPFRLHEHLQRLNRSLSLVDINIDPAKIDLERIIREGIERAGFPRTLAYIQITRGAAPRNHQYPADLKPTVVATFKPRPDIEPSRRETGISVMTVEDTRWSRCEVKSIALLPNILAKNRAVRDGFDDAIFVADGGIVREATSANVFIVRDGCLHTPVLDESILHGVTRGFLLDCAANAGVSVVEDRITVNQLTSADEVFISSTSVDVLPVTRVNNEAIRDGRPGPITRQIYRTFLASLPRD